MSPIYIRVQHISIYTKHMARQQDHVIDVTVTRRTIPTYQFPSTHNRTMPELQCATISLTKEPIENSMSNTPVPLSPG